MRLLVSVLTFQALLLCSAIKIYEFYVIVIARVPGIYGSK